MNLKSIRERISIEYLYGRDLMSIKYRKDEVKLLGKLKLRGLSKPYFLEVFLWVDKKALLDNTYYHNRSAEACFDAPAWFEYWTKGATSISRKFGEVHFYKGGWNHEVVAHELIHALMFRMRVLRPYFEQMRDGYEKDNAEEFLAYEYAAWFDKTFNWLWNLDPSEKWKKIESESHDSHE